MNIYVLINACVLVLSPIVVYFVARPSNRQRVLEYTLNAIDRDSAVLAVLVLCLMSIVILL
ncbi:MAG: hypothetical protein ACJAYC_002321 [Halieaceae bacterium]|jgi:hypothetical protein